MNLIYEILWLVIYIYYIYQCGNFEKGKWRTVILFLTCTAFLAFFLVTGFHAGWVLISVILLGFDYFYDKEPATLNWHYLLAPGLFIAVIRTAFWKNELFTQEIITVIFLWLCLLLLSVRRKNKTRGYLLLTCIIYGGITAILYCFGIIRAQSDLLLILYRAIIVLAVLLFLLLENVITGFQRGFEKDSRIFKDEVLKHQYEEIKAIYLNMRGWRHDYHNHLQVMKAYMAFGQMEQLENYLNELELELSKVDAYVKSGNLMLDAILNSKLSLMERSGIVITCKTDLTAGIPVQEVDLCVMLGNLLDNAMEACEQIPQDERFVRVYIAVRKKQFYISVQNSAKEELDFNERNYISGKRGNHGFGIKRVKALTDKYEGFLNLQNEPGIFAAEITLPIKEL